MKEKLEELGNKAHISYLSVSKTAVIDGVEMTVLPYGYLEQAVKQYAKEYADWKIKECLPERRSTANYTNSHDVIMHSGYDDGWNACIDHILNKDKK